MLFQVVLDSSNPVHAVLLRQLLEDPVEAEVSPDFIRSVSRSKTGQELLVPLVRAMEAGKEYTADELADLVGSTAVIIGHRISALGRSEKLCGCRLFERVGTAKTRAYLISDEMKRAFSEEV